MIYDYKTGKLPRQKQVEELYAPQLSLEGAIAEGGGFEGLGEGERQRARLYHASGRDDGGEERAAAKTSPAVLASEALQRLRDLIARYADPAMPYEVKRRSGPFARAYDYDEYEHLARVEGMADARGRGGVPMSARTLPPEADANQARASDPSASAWVSANAGTGKTEVLVRRCLRLLLGGFRARVHSLPDLHQDRGGGDAEPPAQGARRVGDHRRRQVARERFRR